MATTKDKPDAPAEAPTPEAVSTTERPYAERLRPPTEAPAQAETIQAPADKPQPTNGYRVLVNYLTIPVAEGGNRDQGGEHRFYQGEVIPTGLLNKLAARRLLNKRKVEATGDAPDLAALTSQEG